MDKTPDWRKQAREAFKRDYTPLGISQKPPVVDQVLENKHGIANKVTDLKTGTQKVEGDVIFDGSGNTEPRTYTLQNQDGVVTLQDVATLTGGEVTFPNADGLLTGNPNFTYDGSFLTVPALKDSALTSGRVIFSSTSGELVDSTDLTFDGTILSAPSLAASGLSADVGSWVVIDTDGVLAAIGAPTHVVVSASITDQNDAFSDTLIVDPGLYRVSVYLLDQTMDVTAGTIAATVGWTDTADARTVTTDPVSLVTGGFAEKTIVVLTVDGAIDYSVDLTAGIFGTATYDVYITVENIPA